MMTAPGLARFRLSIVVPVLDEAPIVEAALQALAPLRARGVEVVVVDGGSHDATAALAAPWADAVIAGPRGRAAQMNAGAQQARGSVLLFLHIDTALPAEADRLLIEFFGHFRGRGIYVGRAASFTTVGKQGELGHCEAVKVNMRDYARSLLSGRKHKTHRKELRR